MIDAPTFRRVVVAFGTSREGLATLESWAVLAGRLRAQLVGLFVEDLNVLRMAALPFARVVGMSSIARDVSPETLERLMRRSANEARAALQALAAREMLGWSFETVRCAAAAELLLGVGQRDLLVVDQAALGESAEVLQACPASVLALRPDVRAGRTIFVLAEEGPGVPSELVAAAHLAAATRRDLAVFVRGAEEAARVRDAALAALDPHDRLVRVEAASGGVLALRAELLRQRGAIVVVSPRGRRELAGGGTPPCSLLELRTASPQG